MVGESPPFSTTGNVGTVVRGIEKHPRVVEYVAGSIASWTLECFG
jgi:hypothetical protein